MSIRITPLGRLGQADIDALRRRSLCHGFDCPGARCVTHSTSSRPVGRTRVVQQGAGLGGLDDLVIVIS